MPTYERNCVGKPCLMRMKNSANELPELVEAADVGGVERDLVGAGDGLYGGRRRAHLLPLGHRRDKYLRILSFMHKPRV